MTLMTSWGLRCLPLVALLACTSNPTPTDVEPGDVLSPLTSVSGPWEAGGPTTPRYLVDLDGDRTLDVIDVAAKLRENTTYPGNASDRYEGIRVSVTLDDPGSPRVPAPNRSVKKILFSENELYSFELARSITRGEFGQLQVRVGKRPQSGVLPVCVGSDCFAWTGTSWTSSAGR